MRAAGANWRFGVSLLKLTLEEFLARLAAREPTPGGGAVAALVGALAASLGRMVAAYTLGNEKFAANEPEVRAINKRLDRAGQMLCRLIDEDAAAYGVLSEAFKLDRSDPDRKQRIAGAAGLAGSVPLETAALAARIRRDLKALCEIGNPMLRSDAEAAMQLARAAAQAAAENVRANLSLMSEAQAAEISKQLASLVQNL